MRKLLVIDDEPGICYSFRRIFSDRGVIVLTAGTLAEGRDRLTAEMPDVIVLDLQLPDGSGMDMLSLIQERDPKRPVILITAHGSTETAIEAMKFGAFDYLSKPLVLEQVSLLLERAFEAARLMQVPAQLPNEPDVERIVGRSAMIQEMGKTIGRIAPQDVNVLILGESGTGKELVARALYHHSKRADKPFLAINCAALPEALVESELFGHEQGAFTGADRKRIGKFEQCRDGTILLDEIGDMPLPAQAKMLRLLQDQQFERVGGNQTLTTRVRILASTNRDLEQLVTDGKFRADLYFRLRVVTITVPTLRERKEDIPELTHYFLHLYNRELSLQISGLGEEVMELFQRYDWPGNVRELQGVLKEAMLKSTARVILPEILSPTFRQPRTTGADPASSSDSPDIGRDIEALFAAGEREIYDRIIRGVEKELITRALRHTRGHQAQASDLLGINRTTLRNKLRELGLSVDRVVGEAEHEAAGN